MFKLMKKKGVVPEGENLAAMPNPEAGNPASEESRESEASEPEALEPEAKPDEAEKKEATEEENPAGEFEAWLTENVEDADVRGKSLEAYAFVTAALAGETDKEELYRLIVKGADYGAAVERAAAEGEVRGRNANITEQMEMELDSDGVPHPGVGGNVYNAPVPSIFELARGASM